MVIPGHHVLGPQVCEWERHRAGGLLNISFVASGHPVGEGVWDKDGDANQECKDKKFFVDQRLFHL